MDRVHPGVRGPLTEGPCLGVVHVVGNVPRLVRNPIKRTFFQLGATKQWVTIHAFNSFPETHLRRLGNSRKNLEPKKCLVKQFKLTSYSGTESFIPSSSQQKNYCVCVCVFVCVSTVECFAHIEGSSDTLAFRRWKSDHRTSFFDWSWKGLVDDLQTLQIFWFTRAS